MAFWSKRKQGEIIEASPGQIVSVNKEDVVVPKAVEPQISYLVSYACEDKHISGGEARNKPDRFIVCKECGKEVKFAVAKVYTTYVYSSIWYSVISKHRCEFVRFLDED